GGGPAGRRAEVGFGDDRIEPLRVAITAPQVERETHDSVTAIEPARDRAESEDGQNDGADDHQNRHQQAAASAVRTADEPDPASAVTASISTARAPADRAPAEAAPAPESATVPARRGGYEKKHRKQNPSDQC